MELKLWIVIDAVCLVCQCNTLDQWSYLGLSRTVSMTIWLLNTRTNSAAAFHVRSSLLCLQLLLNSWNVFQANVWSAIKV